jgi:hypothetical protein
MLGTEPEIEIELRRELLGDGFVSSSSTISTIVRIPVGFGIVTKDAGTME